MFRRKEWAYEVLSVDLYYLRILLLLVPREFHLSFLGTLMLYPPQEFFLKIIYPRSLNVILENTQEKF